MRGATPRWKVRAAVDWDDLTLSRGILQSSHHQARALTDKAGRFSLCSLPVESPLRLRISADGFRQFETELALPPDGVLRHTFRLADEKLATGTGSIAARVVDSFAG